MQTPTVPVGPTTILGVAAALVGAVGALVAAIQANDVATISSAAAGVLVILTTLGGRYAQAVVVAKRAAPYLQAAAHALDAGPEIADEFEPATHIADEPVVPPGLTSA